ncbi:MAG: pilin [Candidatus Moraniibacteriota bacterium]
MKKIKIVLLGVILVGGFFSQREKVLAQEVCGSSKVPPFGSCQAWCSGTDKEDVAGSEECKVNTIQTTCCVAGTVLDNNAKSSVIENAIKDANERAATALKEVENITNQGCCIKTLIKNDPDYGKSLNCKDIDLTKIEQVASCPILGKIGREACRFHPAECGVSTSVYEENAGTPNTTNLNSPIEFSNPIGVTTVSGLLDSILNNLMGLIVIIAVIFIIIGGIMYMTSAGNEKMVTRAKQTWTGATVGLAIALASPTFLKQIKIILESNSDTGGSADAWVNKALTIKDIAINVLNFLLSVFGVLAIIALVIGGGMYLTAYGDEKKIDSGKKIITYAIIGIVVALSALVVTRQIANLIGVMAK